MAEADFVLYVGRRAIELIDQAGLQDRVTVQSVDALRESMSALPPWLKGTPTLVCRETRKAMRGTAALEHLSELASKAGEEGHGGGEASASHGLDGMVAPGEAMHLGTEANFEPLAKDDPDKYDDSRKVTEDDIQRMLERRRAAVPSA